VFSRLFFFFRVKISNDPIDFPSIISHYLKKIDKYIRSIRLKFMIIKKLPNEGHVFCYIMDRDDLYSNLYSDRGRG
jgi:hypothetical protein